MLNRLPSSISALLDSRSEGHSLPAGLYIREDVFEADIEVFLATPKPLVEPERLILQSMRQFVRKHRALEIGNHPIEEIHGLGFRVVVSFDLLLKQGH